MITVLILAYRNKLFTHCNKVMGQPLLTAYQDRMDRCVTSAILNVVYHYYIYTRRDAFSQQRWIQVGGGREGHSILI